MRTYITEEKETVNTTDGTMENSYLQEHNLRDWNIDNPIEYIRWSEGEPLPSSKELLVILPEIEKLKKAEEYSNYSYQVQNFNTDYVHCEGKDVALSGEISELENGKLPLIISFVNFESLPQNQTSTIISIRCEGTATDQSVETIEEQIVEIVINNTSADDYTIHGSKCVYQTTFNLNNKQFYPPLQIPLVIANIDPDLFVSKIITIPRPYGPDEIQLRPASHSIASQQSSVQGLPHIIHFEPSSSNPFIMNADGFRSTYGGELSNLTEHKDSFFLQFQVRKKNQMSGFGPVILAKSSLIGVAVSFTKNNDYFAIEKTKYRWEISEDTNEVINETVSIDNPFDTQFTISNSPLVTTNTIYDNKKCLLTFSIETAKLLPGLYHASVSVSNGFSEKIIFVELWIKPQEQFQSRKLYFCQDCGPINVYKSNGSSSYATMTITMIFTGYGVYRKEIQQKYENVFFENHLQFYPGEEVQDFFPKLQDISHLSSTPTGVSISSLFSSAEVSIKIEERNKTEVFNIQNYSQVYFIPGKKPRAYPYLTNVQERSSYSDSLLSISALSKDMKNRNLHQIVTNKIDHTQLHEDNKVVNISCFRYVADTYYGALNILRKNPLTIEPKLNSLDVIHVLFSNQNYCPEWFSFSSEYEQYLDLNHILDDGRKNHILRKVKTESIKKIKLNTGWIFHEEIELLDELVDSNICFMRIGEQWLCATAISKKTLSIDNDRNLNSMIVEFEILTENER